MRRGIRSLSDSIHPTSELRRRFAKAFRYADLTEDERIDGYFHWIAPSALAPLFHADLRRKFESSVPDRVLDRLAALPESMPPLHRMLYLEGKYFLTDHNLNYVDKVSMANGIEVRVPFLDPDLMSLAAKLPLRYKQRGRVGKWVLRKAMEPYLPKEIRYRAKTGFGAPLRHWLRNDLRPIVDDVLSDRSLNNRGLFDPRAVQQLIALDRNRQMDATYTIFSMICVELWCRMFIDEPTPAVV
jgi:asparagine synthase (glutamine-hydrolysing)